MNEVLNTIARRYSCRAFKDIMPSEDNLRAIANAAVCAPSGLNRQAWRVIVVEDKQLLTEMDEEAMRVLKEQEDKSSYERMMERGGRLFYKAPCMLMLPTADGLSAQLDCGILCQTAVLSAASLGIDSLICGLARCAFAGAKGDYFKARLGFPAGYEFGIAILLGYAVHEGKPHEPDLGKISFV